MSLIKSKIFAILLTQQVHSFSTSCSLPASGKMRVCGLGGFQTCKMLIVLRIFLRTWQVKCGCGRNIIGDLIETFKIVNRKYVINPELFFQLDECDRRGHDHKLFKKRFRLNVRKYAFSNRVIDNWNLLSVSCVNCSTINTFKKHLSSELESEAVKFKVSQLW